MSDRPLRRIALLIALLTPLLLGLAASCSPARHLMRTASPGGTGPAATPPLAASTYAEWAPARERWLAHLASELYGPAPPAGTVSVQARELVDPNAYGGLGRLERVQLDIRTPDAPEPLQQTLALVLPVEAVGPVPVILVPGECGLAVQLSRPDWPAAEAYRPSWCDSSDGGLLADLAEAVFGTYVLNPPIEMILARGYGLAVWHESELAPDESDQFNAALEQLGLSSEAPNRPGAISVWAWTMSRIADQLVTDPRIDANRLVVMGHSRRGKAALLAAARDPRFAAVIAHQSGTAGASLHRDQVGEPIGAITAAYPHWFSPSYARYADDETALPVDQHHLLALIAPRAVLLGNARRDTWSDPAGAWRAARAASPIWALYDTAGLVQTEPDRMTPEGRISYYIRPGLHGVRTEDWAAFLAFLDDRL